MHQSDDYNARRKRNIEDNKRILAELGILNPFNPLPKIIKQRAVVQPSKKRKRDECAADDRPGKKHLSSLISEKYGSRSELGKRRSSRLLGKDAKDLSDIEEEVKKELEDESPKKIRIPSNRPNYYGAVEGVEVGRCWISRIHACADGIHRPTVAGIHAGPEGAYSLALSGGYEDDIDMGDCFTYTGEGGRDLKGTKANPKNLRTAPQSKDQTLTRGNLALATSVDTGNPVRVIRGYKLRSPFAPEDGYRYDGLYKVERYWFTTGMSGFGVYKFALRRIDCQDPPPWTLESSSNQGCSIDNGKITTPVESPVVQSPAENIKKNEPFKERFDENDNIVLPQENHKLNICAAEDTGDLPVA